MKELVAISIVPSEAQAPVGRLDNIDLANWLVSVRDTLRATETTKWAVLCTDLSVTDCTARNLGTVWQFQVYGIALTTNRRKLREAIKRAYPATPMVPRPIRTRTFDCSARAASYVFKYQFVRRVSYQKSTSKRTYWKTRKLSLKAYQHIELMIALGKLGITNRVRLIGLYPALQGGKTILKRI